MTHRPTAKICARNAFVVFIATLTFLIFPVPARQGRTGELSAIVSATLTPAAQTRILESYGRLPLSFEVNEGQADARVKFLTRTSGYSLFLTGNEAVLALRSGGTTAVAKALSTADKTHPRLAAYKGTPELRMKLRNANPAVQATGLDQLAGTSNYFIGKDPAKWRRNVPTYAKVKYEGIYSGIDLVYYGNQRQLEYDFIVAPGANPGQIEFEFRTAEGIHRDAQGDLVFKMGEDEIRWNKPIVYQEPNGTRHEIAASYRITNRNRVGFEVAKYDASKPLYIDPLIYSTYLGGKSYDHGNGIAVDGAGNAYVTGYSDSTFPIVNALQPIFAGGYYDAFVAKINPAGSALIYSTYLGGSADDEGNGIAVDSAGNAYVAGQTFSADFPTLNGLQPTPGGSSDAFVVKIDPTGSALLYSTYLGGTSAENGTSIAVDSARNAYVTGWTISPDFPIVNPLQQAKAGDMDAFVAKISPTGTVLLYSSYLGGTDYDFGAGIAVDRTGSAYLAGFTESTDFPTRNPLQASNAGGLDAFLAKINATGTALVYSTYLGGLYDDAARGIAVDSAGNAYITGYTHSTDFPIVNALQPSRGGGFYDAFVAKSNADGSALFYSTYLGGSGDDVGEAIAVDTTGNVHVVGQTSSIDFPTTPGALQTVCNYGNCTRPDSFVTMLDASGSALAYSTYLGGGFGSHASGIGLDNAGNSYVTGYTESFSFPTKNPFQATNGSYNLGYRSLDAFITKIDERAGITITLSSSPNPSLYGQAVTFTAVVSGPAPPDGESITFKSGTVILGTGSLSGGSAAFTTSTLAVGKNLIDAVYGGDSRIAGSTSKTVKQTVSGYTTVTALASNLNPSLYGQRVTFTANVSGSGALSPSGIVAFTWGTAYSTYSIGTATLNNGVATLTKSNLNADPYNLVATYKGDVYNLRSTSPVLNQAVLQTTSAAVITSSLNPSSLGQAVTFTAKISSPTVIPAGLVTFTAGKTVLGTAQLSGGKATFTTSSLPVGSTVVTVTYDGSSNITKSAAALSQSVH